MYDEDTLYVYSYSDFDEDYVFMETKYELSDVKRLEQENQQLKEQLQNISNEFLKYDWKTSNKEQIINQLESLYNSIFRE